MVTNLFIESEPFTVEPGSAQLNIVKGWDYSADESLVKPLRNQEPKGVAADGTSRIYLSVSPKAGIKYIENISLTLKDETTGYSDTRLLGKVIPATVTGSYSEEGNNANSTVAVNNADGQDVYHFWYVAPDDFTGIDEDINKSSRLVKAVFDVKFTDNTTTQEFCYIEVVRPALMLVHGLASSGESCWKDFSLRNNLNYKRDNRFIVKEAIDVWPDVSFDKNAMGLLHIIEPYAKKSTFEAMNLLMMNKGYASNRVDYICHSMGGCILRYAVENYYDNFHSVRNYKKGFTNKVITINTPHEGSPVSDMLAAMLDFIYSNKYAKFGNEILSMFYDINDLYENYRYENWALNPFHYVSPTQIEPLALQNILIWWSVLFENDYDIPYKRNFTRTAAVRNLGIADGVRFMKTTPVNAHLIAGDLFPPIQDWKTFGTLDFSGFNNYFSRYESFQKTINWIEKGLEFFLKVKEINGQTVTADFDEFVNTISELSNATEELGKPLKVIDTFLSLVNAIIHAANTASFVADFDLVVPLKSQLAGNYNIQNSTIVNGYGANHMSIVNNTESGNIVENLLNSSIKTVSKFGPIPPSIPQVRTLRGINQTEITSIKFHPYSSEVDINKIEITPPTPEMVFSGSEMPVYVKIKDLASLKYVELNFQGETYRKFDVEGEELIFNVPVGKTKLGNSHIITKANYFYPDSMYTAYAGAVVNVVTEETPIAFSCSQKIFRCNVEDVIRPGYEVIYPTFISRFGVNREMNVTILGKKIVDFDADDCSFIAKEEGTTYIELDYKGLKDTVYFMIEKSESPIVANEEFYPEEAAHSSLDAVVYPNPVDHEFTLVVNCVDNEQIVVAIYNLYGQKVDDRTFTGNSAVFNTSRYPKGVYLVQITTESGRSVTRKLVKR